MDASFSDAPWICVHYNYYKQNIDFYRIYSISCTHRKHASSDGQTHDSFRVCSRIFLCGHEYNPQIVPQSASLWNLWLSTCDSPEKKWRFLSKPACFLYLPYCHSMVWHMETDWYFSFFIRFHIGIDPCNRRSTFSKRCNMRCCNRYLLRSADSVHLYSLK